MSAFNRLLVNLTAVRVSTGGGCAVSVLVLLLVAQWATAPQAASAQEPRSVTLTQSKFQSWLAYHGLEPGDPAATATALQEAAVDLELARQATLRGIDERLEKQIQWAQAQYLDRTLRRSMIDAVAVAPERVDERFNTRASELLARPDTVLLHIISKRLPPNGDELSRLAIYSEVEALRRRVVGGESFHDVARAESDSQTRYQGGRIGKIRVDLLPPVTRAAVDAILPGEMSPVFATDSAVQFLFLEERTKPTVPAGLRDRVERQERERVRSEHWRALLPRLADAVPTSACERPSDICFQTDGRAWTWADVSRLLPVSKKPLSKDARAEAIRETALTFAAANHASKIGLRTTAGPNGGLVEHQLSWLRIKYLAGEQERSLVSSEFKPPSEDAVRAEYDRLNAAGSQSLRLPRRYQVSFVSHSATQSTVASSYETMLELRRVLAATPNQWRLPQQFEALDLQTETRLWLSKTAIAGMGPRTSRELEALKPGQISNLVEESVGVRGDRILRIFMLHRIEPPRVALYSEAEAQLKRQLIESKLRELQRLVRSRVSANVTADIQQD